MFRQRRFHGVDDCLDGWPVYELRLVNTLLGALLQLSEPLSFVWGTKGRGL
jgi:hypothetical protein